MKGRGQGLQHWHALEEAEMCRSMSLPLWQLAAPGII